MSTLTKVLIILLTVFSIFLCGIVVTYVANADNYRAEANKVKRDRDAAIEVRQDALGELEQQKQTTEDVKNELGKQISELQVTMTGLQGQLDALKRENAQLVQKVADMAAVVETANQTAKQQTVLFENAQQEVQTLRAEQTNRKRELDETNQVLLERLTVIAQLEEKNRQLIEENQELTQRLSRTLQPYGRAPVRPATVTPQRAIAQPAGPVPVQPPDATPKTTKEIGLQGRVTQVDMKNRMAAISIGSAAGVRQDMKFHVTRGDRFICDILILDVDPERSVGILDLVQAEPQPGDFVTTNL